MVNPIDKYNNINDMKSFHLFVSKLQPKIGVFGGRYFVYDGRNYSYNSLINKLKDLNNKHKTIQEVSFCKDVINLIKKHHNQLNNKLKKSPLKRICTRLKRLFSEKIPRQMILNEVNEHLNFGSAFTSFLNQKEKSMSQFIFSWGNDVLLSEVLPTLINQHCNDNLEIDAWLSLMDWIKNGNSDVNFYSKEWKTALLNLANLFQKKGHIIYVVQNMDVFKIDPNSNDGNAFIEKGAETFSKTVTLPELINNKYKYFNNKYKYFGLDYQKILESEDPGVKKFLLKLAIIYAEQNPDELIENLKMFQLKPLGWNFSPEELEILKKINLIPQDYKNAVFVLSLDEDDEANKADKDDEELNKKLLNLPRELQFEIAKNFDQEKLNRFLISLKSNKTNPKAQELFKILFIELMQKCDGPICRFWIDEICNPEYAVKLNHLDLSNSHLSEDQIILILRACPNLTSINLESYYSLSDEIFKAFPPTLSSLKLRELNAQQVKLLPSSIKDLELSGFEKDVEWPDNIQSLNISSFIGKINDLFKKIPKSLKVFEFSGQCWVNDFIKSEDLLELPKGLVSLSLPLVRFNELDVSHLPRQLLSFSCTLGDNIITEEEMWPPQIQKLEFEACKSENINKLPTTLTSLKINLLDYEGLKGCCWPAQLQKLDISFVNEYKKTNLVGVLSHFPKKLKYLVLPYPFYLGTYLYRHPYLKFKYLEEIKSLDAFEIQLRQISKIPDYMKTYGIPDYMKEEWVKRLNKRIRFID